MTILSICQDAAGRMGLVVPSAVVTATDAITKEMYRLAKQEGKELSRRGSWRALTTEKTFTTVATAAQTDALPSDLDWIIPETMFNRTMNRIVDGPLSAEEWQGIQASLVTRVWPAYRVRGTSLLMTPTPTAGDTVGYEYITKNWCQSSLSVAQSTWAADTDTALLDEELHTLGLIWRFKRAKGLDFEAEAALYDTQVRLALHREGSKPRISTDPFGNRYPSADVLAAARGNVILSTDGDGLAWD